MASKASKQLFLLDACRSTPPELRSKYKPPTPPELLTPNVHSNQGSHEQAELCASELGASAFGVDDNPSVFMASLLTSMKGTGALQNDDEDWVVGTASLRTGLDWLVKRAYGKDLQRVAFGKMSADFALHTVVGTPSVAVTVKTRPLAKLAELHLQTDCPQYRPVPDGKPWYIDVPAGNRSFYAADAANPKAVLTPRATRTSVSGHLDSLRRRPMTTELVPDFEKVRDSDERRLARCWCSLTRPQPIYPTSTAFAPSTDSYAIASSI
jgi:hypothetical protein